MSLPENYALNGALKDKVVLVVGSTTGIGAAIARASVAAGAKVMVHGRNEAHAKALVEELGGAEHAAYVLHDAAEPDVGDVLVAATVKQFGAIDSIANNVGIYPRSHIEDVTPESFSRMFDINVRSHLLTIRAAIPHMEKQGGGSVVCTGSINAYCGQTDILEYSMSKGALMAMCRNLGERLFLENKIRVNLLNVGWTVTETEWEARFAEGMGDDWEKDVPAIFRPAGKLLRPAEVANHMVFWMSDLSYPVSGQVYEVEEYPVIGRNPLTYVQSGELSFKQKGE